MTCKFNFQACRCLLCFAMFQQFYKLEIQNSENSNNSLICFAAVPVCTLSFCNNSLTNFNTWAPAAPVPVLRPESVCGDTKGWALGTEGQDSAPGCWHCPRTAPRFMPQLLSPPPRLLLLQLSPPLIRARSQAPRSPGCPGDTPMYVCVAIGPIAQCQAPGLSLLLIRLFPSSHRTCLQNASAKMKLSKLSRWQPQSLNHTHWVRDHTIPDSVHMKPSHRLGKAALASICPFLSVVPPFNSSARGAGGRHRLPRLTSPSSPCCTDRQ